MNGERGNGDRGNGDRANGERGNGDGPENRSDIGGRLLAAMFDYGTYRLGPDTSRRVFTEAAASTRTTLEAATDLRGWVSLATFHAVADGYRPLLGESFVRDTFTWAVPVRRDFSAMSMSALMSPALMYRFLDRARSFFAHHLLFEVTPVSAGHVDVTLRYRKDVPRRRDSCDVGWGVLLSIPLLFDRPAAIVTEVACYAHGADACSYRVRFEPQPAFGLHGLAAGAAVSLAGLAVWPSSLWALAPAIGLWAGRELGTAAQRRHMGRVTEDHRRLLEENEREFKLRYDALARLNEQLELRVQERTQQIEDSMVELQKQNASMRETIDAMEALRAGIVDAGVRRLSPSVQEFAHEIKNPMTTVVSNLDYLAETADDPARVAITDLSQAAREARVGIERIRGVLAWFLEINQESAVAPYDIEAELESMAMLHATSPNSRHVQLDLRFGNVGAVDGHGKQLTQVFSNLLLNAAQAMGAGRLIVETHLNGDSAAVVFRDTGPGIDPAIVETLFERGITTKTGTGSGLGLYISRAIVVRHGGTIEATRDEETGGARFTVRLPRQRVATT